MNLHMVTGSVPVFNPHRFRQWLGDEIDRMIGMLDALDGDPDFEETGDDEPSLGWPEQVGLAQIPLAATDDREEENEHGGDILDQPHDEERVDDEEDYREMPLL